MTIVFVFNLHQLKRTKKAKINKSNMLLICYIIHKYQFWRLTGHQWNQRGKPETSGDQKRLFLIKNSLLHNDLKPLTTLPLSQTAFPRSSLHSAHLSDCLQDVKQSGITSAAGWELKSARWWTYPAPKSSSTSPVIKVRLQLYPNKQRKMAHFLSAYHNH